MSDDHTDPAAGASDRAGTPAPPARVLWRGAISFGLVHVPVALYSATSPGGVDFDWLDRRSMAPVGYQRINKQTGQPVAAADVVKGVDLGDGHYVVLTAAEIKAALPKVTQTIEIECFIHASEMPFVYLERPYYLAPTDRGDKVYALLREALLKTQRVGVARVVIQTQQHLAVLVPSGPALILNLLRWGGQIRSFEALHLPPAGVQAAGLKDSDLKLACQLIEDMAAPWNADAFRDSFKDEILRLVHEKAESGQVQRVAPPEPAGPGADKPGAEIIDLTELLKRSLQGERAAAEPDTTEPADAHAAKPAAKKTGRRKPA